jgi:hypothetical protein
LISSDKKLFQTRNVKNKSAGKAPRYFLHHKTLKLVSYCQNKPKFWVIIMPSGALHCSLAGIGSGHAPLVKSGPGTAKEGLF